MRRATWLRTLVTVVTATAALAVMLPRLAVANASSACGDVARRPWCDRHLSADRRADLLLRALTEAEKIRLLAGVTTSHTGQTPAIPRVGLRSVFLTDDSKGVKQGSATALPIPMAIAASFNPRVADLAGAIIGDEAKHKGNDILLGPTVNIMRTPLGGRTFEAYGEDPYLVSETAVSWIKGLQRQGEIAEVKHFCCNNQEGPPYSQLKMFSSSNLDERTLREIYLPAFEAAVTQGHAGSVMCAYNRVNEDWACENHHLLTDILRREWGFKGVVVSDWQAQHNTVSAMRNGLDVEMPTPADYSATRVQAALAAGLITQSEIDDHVRNFLRTLFAFGFFDRPAYRDDNRIDFAAHAADAQRIEEAGMVLLKNDHVLPLGGATLHSIALIGPQAARYENGAGTDDVIPQRTDTPLAEIRKRAGPHVQVTYDDGSDRTRAAAVAKAADVAIVFASDQEGEDREKLSASVDGSAGPPTDQNGLIDAIAAANRHTVVVLETGDPVLTPWRDHVAGLLEAWYPGEAGGAALTHVLFGDVDPSGRLPATFPQQESDIPTADDPTASNGPEVYYREGVFVGYRWYDERHLVPAYPFGAGLSYTTFRLSNLAVRRAAPGSGAVATVRVTVTNTGDRTGVAVPQLYVALPSPSASVPQPPRQLKGYRSLTLKPGARAVVTFALDRRALSYWSVAAGGWRIAPGCYGIFVGTSSRDLPLRGVVPMAGASCRR